MIKENSNEMEATLNDLISSLQYNLGKLKTKHKEELSSALHNHHEGNLPEKKLAGLAHEAIDLLHETEQMLEPGSLVLADQFLGFMTSKCLCAAVELRIPDILGKEAKTLPELAEESGARADRLRQVLRVLYNVGIFYYDPTTDSFSNNHTSTLLLSDHWTQWHNWVDLYGNVFYDMARSIPAQIKKDETRMAGQIEFNTEMDMFSYFNAQGWLPRLHRTLGGGAIAQAPGILEDYPWETVADSTIMDVGGGGGALIALLLRKHKSMRGGILDLPSVIEHAKTLFHTTDGRFADVGDRVAMENLIAGDFLEEIPRFEVYTMKWCLHDWSDSKALKVLTNIRKAIIPGPKSRLIVLESILKDGRMGRLSRYGDITMMISANGQERTEKDWRRLASQTGWNIAKIYPLRDAWPCAIEMTPV